jgi:hypothetical protein
MLRVAHIGAHPLIRKLGQNIVFDATFMFHKYGILIH